MNKLSHNKKTLSPELDISDATKSFEHYYFFRDYIAKYLH